MGKALVIKNVSFATNKLTTVEFDEEIPCTGIALDESTVSMTAVGTTETITATVTPADTTDAVIWSSSDPSVVSVSGGVLTQTGVGTATITATCGTETATCTVSTVNTLSFGHYLARVNLRGDQSTKDYVFNQVSGDAYASLQSDVETTKSIWMYQITPEVDRYPILLGDGADTVTITVPNTIRPTVQFTDSETACTYSVDHSSFEDRAKVIYSDKNAYDSTVSLGTRVLTIPEGADSILVTLQYPNNTMTDEIVQSVSIVASKSAS